MTMAGSWWVKALNPNGVRVRSYQPVWQTYLAGVSEKNEETRFDAEKDSVDSK